MPSELSVVRVEVSPSLSVLAVEKEYPSFSFLLACEGVVAGARSSDSEKKGCSTDLCDVDKFHISVYLVCFISAGKIK
jgi:hypothetical protein